MEATAKVSFKEVPPDADQLVQHLRKDPARYAELLVKYSKRQIEDAPYVQKGKKRAELETKTIVPANQKKQREKDAKYQEIIDLAVEMRAKYPLLRSAYALAKKINKLNPTIQNTDVSARLKKIVWPHVRRGQFFCA